MSTPAALVKNILQPAKGKDRLPLLLKICDMPSYWGEQDELQHLQEANEIAHDKGSADEHARTIYMLGKYCLRKASYLQADTHFSEALQLYTETGNKYGIVDCKAKLSAVNNYRSLFENALQTGEETIALAASISYNQGLTDALHVKAYALQSIGNLSEALTLCIKALDIDDATQDIYRIAASYYCLGAVYDGMASYHDALSNHAFALKIREDIGDRFGISESLNAIGAIHWKQSSHVEATKYLFRALKIEEETGDKFGLANSHNIIGNINSNLGNYEDAIMYYQLARELYKELDHRRGVVTSFYNTGIIHYELNNYDEALINHLNALNLSKEIGHKELICATHNYTGKVYTALGKYDDALHYQQQALITGQELGDQRRIGIAHTGIGDTYTHLGEYKLAAEHLTAALATGRELGEKTIIKDALNTLTEVCKKEGEFEQALEYFAQYYKVQNEISNESVQKQLATLNFQHSLEVKEKESAILKVKNEEIQRYLHRLEISNNELKQFAHVAAHDLREPLRMISAYIDLLNQSIGGNLNDTEKKFIKYAVEGSKRMDLLIGDMLRLAKVDAEPKIEKIELSSVINEIKLNLDALMKEKNSRIVSDELPVIMADRTQMLQLFQNIIGNGMKYNENSEPAIEIKHTVRGNELCITIADNGIGIPAESREKVFQIFKRVSTAKKYSGSGIGLAICKKIVDSMHGKIWIEDNPGGGSVFNILLNNLPEE